MFLANLTDLIAPVLTGT